MTTFTMCPTRTARPAAYAAITGASAALPPDALKSRLCAAGFPDEREIFIVDDAALLALSERVASAELVLLTSPSDQLAPTEYHSLAAGVAIHLGGRGIPVRQSFGPYDDTVAGYLVPAELVVATRAAIAAELGL